MLKSRKEMNEHRKNGKNEEWNKGERNKRIGLNWIGVKVKVKVKVELLELNWMKDKLKANFI